MWTKFPSRTTGAVWTERAEVEGKRAKRARAEVEDRKEKRQRERAEEKGERQKREKELARPPGPGPQRAVTFGSVNLRGASLIRKRRRLGPYGRPTPRALRKS